MPRTRNQGTDTNQSNQIVAGTLNVQGTVDLDTTLNVDGDVTLGDDLVVADAVTVGGTQYIGTGGKQDASRLEVSSVATSDTPGANLVHRMQSESSQSAAFGFRINAAFHICFDTLQSGAWGQGYEIARATRDFFAAARIIVGGLASAGANALGIKAGTSTNDAAVGGVLYVSTATVGQVNGGPDTLASYAVPANTLAVNNQSLWWEAWGTCAVGATVCTILIKYGATTIQTITGSPASDGTWEAKGRILRTGAAAQISRAQSYFAENSTSKPSNSQTTPAETLSGAVTFAITGNSSSAATNDTVVKGLIIGWDDANT